MGFQPSTVSSNAPGLFDKKPSSRKLEKLRKPKDFNERTVEVPKFVKEAMKDFIDHGGVGGGWLWFGWLDIVFFEICSHEMKKWNGRM